MLAILRETIALLSCAMIFSQVAIADDLESKLYKSCISFEKDNALCGCQAKKWASGKIQKPKDKAQSLKIEPRFIERKIASWRGPEGKNLSGDDGEITGIALNIIMSCGQELGLLKKK